ncbi:MAG: VOC family protein [Acidimicrobiales bacterium]
MAHNVVHFAITADDVERARHFYERVFGWTFAAFGPPGFYQVTTGDAAHPGIHGALHQRSEPVTGTGIRGFVCTVAVRDLQPIRAAVVAQGGTIVHHEVAIPGVGTLVQFRDTEDNELAAMVYDTEMFGA